MFVYLGRHPNLYNSEGNRRLKDLVRQMLPKYLDARAKNTRAAKSQILRNTLQRAKEEELVFVRMVNEQEQNATTKESLSKISHLFRDMIIAGKLEVPKKVVAVAPRKSRKAMKEKRSRRVSDSSDDSSKPVMTLSRTLDEAADLGGDDMGDFMDGIEDLEVLEVLLGLDPTQPSQDSDQQQQQQRAPSPEPILSSPTIGEDDDPEDFQPISMEDTTGSDLLLDSDLFEALDSLATRI